MAINWVAILGVSIIAMAGAMLWFGPLFWKLWMKIHGWENLSKDDLKKQEEWMWKLLVLEALSTFIMMSVLAFLLISLPQYSPFIVALLVWWWFAVPNTISGVIWWADQKQWFLTKITILSGFNLTILLLSSYLLRIFT